MVTLGSVPIPEHVKFDDLKLGFAEGIVTYDLHVYQQIAEFNGLSLAAFLNTGGNVIRFPLSDDDRRLLMSLDQSVILNFTMQWYGALRPTGYRNAVMDTLVAVALCGTDGRHRR